MMRSVIILNKKSLIPFCGKTLVEHLIEKLKSYGFNEIYLYPLSYARFLKNVDARFVGSLKNFKEDALVIKGNVFVKNFKMGNENVFVDKKGNIIAFYGKPSKNFRVKGKSRRINAIEIKNEKEVEELEGWKEGMERDIIYRYVNSRLSQPISSKLCSTYMMSWQIFMASLLLSFSAFLFYSSPLYIYAVVAGVMVGITSILNDAGNEIEHMKKEKNYPLEIFSYFILLLGASYHAWIVQPSVYIWISAIFISMSLALIEKIGDGILGRDFLLISILIGTFTNQIFISLVIAAIAMNADIIRRMVST